MRSVLGLPLALAVACSSSVSPERDSLSGLWYARSNMLPAGAYEMHLSLTQAADTITGTAALDLDGGSRTILMQVRGRAGLNGSMSCFPVGPSIGPSTCHVAFQFQAADASGDTVYFWGQFLNHDLLYGDIQSTNALPFWNVDGKSMEFDRVKTLPL